MQNSNLYKVLAIIDLIITTINKDPSVPIEIAPVDYSQFDFDEDIGSGGTGGSDLVPDSGSDGEVDLEDKEIPLADGVWAEIIEE